MGATTDKGDSGSSSEFVANSSVKLLLLRQVENASQIRNALISGTLDAGITLVKAEMLLDPLQVQVAARKSLLAAARGKMTTRSVTTEILFNLSSSKNITDSLQKFGIGDQDRDLLAVIIADSEDKAKEKKLLELVKGEVNNLEELGQVSDLEKIMKAHKLKNISSQVQSDRKALANLLISKSASKDLTL